jgi:hypothetical protein
VSGYKSASAGGIIYTHEGKGEGGLQVVEGPEKIHSVGVYFSLLLLIVREMEWRNYWRIKEYEACSSRVNAMLP